jgi:hypothetical protein
MASSLPKASILDSIAVATEVFIPTVAKGVILRHPKVEALAERLQLDRTAVRCLQRLRRRYGDASRTARSAPAAPGDVEQLLAALLGSRARCRGR